MSDRYEAYIQTGDSADGRSQAERVGLDLGKLVEDVPFQKTYGLLHRAQPRFLEAHWLGGLDGGEGPCSVNDVLVCLEDLHFKRKSAETISANQRLAIHEALVFLGYYPADEQLIEKLRDDARMEIENQVLVPAVPALSRELRTRKGRKRAETILLLVGILIAVGGREPHQSRVAPLENTAPRFTVYTENSYQNNDDEVVQATPQEESVREKANQLAQDIGNAVVEILNPIPLVEDVEGVSKENPSTVWGIDFANSRAGVSITWDDQEIIQEVGNEPLSIISFPRAKASEEIIMWKCPPSSGLDCSWAHDGLITVGGHVGHDNAGYPHSLQDAVEFLTYKRVSSVLGDGTEDVKLVRLTPEESAQRVKLLEHYRPTFGQRILIEAREDDEDVVKVTLVRPQVAIVRIPPRETDTHYEAWWQNRDETLKIAQEVDPTLAQRINLDSATVTYVACGERYPGEDLSEHTDPDATYQVGWLFIFGEAASDTTLTPTPAP